MPSFDENLFGRIAVLNNYLRQDQLEECLEIHRAESPPRTIGEVLLEKGYITREQLQSILEIRRKKSRRVLPRPEEERAAQRSFGELALGLGFISLDDLEEVVLEQERLRQLNLHFGLGEILVSRSKLTVSDVMGILDRQGKSILVCAGCDLHYNVVRFREGRTYRCPCCEGDLVRPRFFETVAADGVIQG
ncbi:MAG: hypothetical protein HY721_13595 [Planctomycetes bacterium]|nr:hypothetical protein [Planctomycetota bacterium]